MQQKAESQEIKALHRIPAVLLLLCKRPAWRREECLAAMLLRVSQWGRNHNLQGAAGADDHRSAAGQGRMPPAVLLVSQACGM